MNKKLLIGPAGCGKTYRLLDEFGTALRESPNPLLADYFFVLPSAEHTERIIALILQRGLKGFFHQRVTTLSRLISDLFESAEENFVSSSSRLLFLRDILEGDSWEYFSEVQRSPGFLNLMSKFLSELKESLISCALFRERMNALKKLEPELAPKYEALASIYERYQARLEAEGLMERQDMLHFFRRKKEKGQWRERRFKKIWMDGFFDFSNLQIEYVEELALLCDEMTITLTQDPPGVREHLFDLPNRTAELLKEKGFRIEIMKPDPQRSSKPALVFLERHLFSETSHPKIKDVQNAIDIFEAVGIQGEVEMIAREIVKTFQSGGYRYSDFALLFREIGNYDPVIRSVFARYGLPFEIHEREKLELSPMVHVIVLLLKIFRDGWNRVDLMNFFKSSYVKKIAGIDKNYAWVSQLEHRAFRQGIRAGREEWLKSWDAESETDDQDIEAFNHAKAGFFKVLADLEDLLRNTHRLWAIKNILFEAMQNTFQIFQVQDSLEDAVRRDAASARRLEALFREIGIHRKAQGTLEDPAINFEEFADQFFRLVELDLYSLHRRDKNTVQIYDVSLARQKEYRVVFVSGLLEKNFPVQIKEDPILSDWERRLVNQQGQALLRERLPRQNIERYLFYIAVTRASERMVLTYPSLDREGKQSLPSFYVDEVKSLFGEALGEPKKQDLSHPYPELEEAVNSEELEIAVMGELWNRDCDQEPLLLYLTNQMLGSAKFGKKMRLAFQQIEARLADPAIATGDYFSARETSATKLEDYAKCPYKYFAGRVLKLKDPEENFNSRLKGTILHQVLENYFRLRLQKPQEFLNPVKVREFVLKELETAMRQNPLISEKKYQFDLEREDIKEMLLRFLDFEINRLQASPLIPGYFEFSFGTGKDQDAPPLEIEIAPGKKSTIKGKIDRIDVDKDRKYGLVIDYKRTAQFKKDDLDLGIALQLPVYLLAVEKWLGLKPVGGELYSLKELKKKGFYHQENASALADLPARSIQLSEKEYRVLLDQSMNYIKRFIDGMDHLDIRVRPRSCESYCPYPSVCRIEKWKLANILEEIKEEDAQLKS